MTNRAKANLPMGSRPRVVNCGMAEHGLYGKEEYELPKLWCLHLYFYEVEMVIGGRRYAIVPGSVTLVPPATRVVYRYAHKKHRHFFVHFGAMSESPEVPVPFLQHVPDGLDELLDRLQNMQRVFTYQKLHAEILFWGILWDLAESGQKLPSRQKKRSSLMKEIDAFIEKRIPQKTTVADVAQALDLSTVHINRIVKGLLGITAIQLIRRRRLQRAYRLLRHSTMPIKLIAAECGMVDLQQFNKLMRGAYGKAPRQLRNEMKDGQEETWTLGRK